MKITKAVKSDAKELFDLENKVFKNDCMAIGLSGFYYHINTNFIYKVVIDEKIVAYILWLERKDFFRLYSLAVLVQYRALGIASKLLEYSLENLESKNMQLEVRKSNKKAIKLYEKFGFKIYKNLEAYYGDEDGVMMRLER
ncbi:MAG: GNAT family N-acetyltransferase [Halarcobacter sp.]